MRIIPVLFPSDLGRSDRGRPVDTGLRGAPDVLLDLLEEQGVRFGRPVVLDVPTPEEPDPEDAPLKFDGLLTEASQALAEAVADINARADFPLILGGDHTALLGHVLGHSKRHRQGIGLAVLADARADLHVPGTPLYDTEPERLRTDPATTPTGDAAGMVLAATLRSFPEGTRLAEAMRASTVEPSRSSVVGVRGPTDAQVARLERRAEVEIWRMERLELDGEQSYRSRLERHLAQGPIALSIDLSGIDPDLLSAVNDPIPDGLDWSFLKRSLEQCVPHIDRVLGLDICELDPAKEEVHGVAQVRFAETVAPFLRRIAR